MITGYISKNRRVILCGAAFSFVMKDDSFLSRVKISSERPGGSSKQGETQSSWLEGCVEMVERGAIQ